MIPEKWKIWRKTNKMSDRIYTLNVCSLACQIWETLIMVVYFCDYKDLSHTFFLNLTQSWKKK